MGHLFIKIHSFTYACARPCCHLWAGRKSRGSPAPPPGSPRSAAPPRRRKPWTPPGFGLRCRRSRAAVHDAEHAVHLPSGVRRVLGSHHDDPAVTVAAYFAFLLPARVVERADVARVVARVCRLVLRVSDVVDQRARAARGHAELALPGVDHQRSPAGRRARRAGRGRRAGTRRGRLRAAVQALDGRQ